MINPREKRQFDYDVCLSFAGEDRTYVKNVAASLRERGVRVFFDEYERTSLWGKDLYAHLSNIYSKSARFCIVFISEHYKTKLWTNHERRAAQARAFEESQEYILQARLDKTNIPGILPTQGYIDISDKTPTQFTDLIVQKVAPYRYFEFHSRENYFPPNPDILIRYLVKSRKVPERFIVPIASTFCARLSQMDKDERWAVANLILNSCPHDFPNNFHINIDMLRRICGWTERKLRKKLSNIESLGFDILFNYVEEGVPTDNVYLFWRSGLVKIRPATKLIVYENRTINAIIFLISRHYCQTHAIQTLTQMNFSALSTATAVEDIHLSG
ncbi:TIR domain-containing protein [Mesorhizobium sp. B2-3-3]|nr:TIR domain-containing protein [Mesorhizobium sp. B2-3-3]